MVTILSRSAAATRRSLIVSLVLALLSLVVLGSLAGPAGAATGNATAQGAQVELTGAADVSGLNLGLGLGGSTPQAQAPATDGTASQGADLNLTAIGADAAVDVTSTSATRAGATTSAQSVVSSAGVTAFGTNVLNTGVISAAVNCPAGGTPTATTNPGNVQIAGTTVDAAAGATVNVPVTVAGLVGANVAVSVSSPHATTGTTASAVGLQAQMTLTANTVLGTAVSLPLGTVLLATANCLTPDVTGGPTSPAAPTAAGIVPASGPTYGGQTVTITGSGFVPGQTDVSFGGLPAAAVDVVDPTSLTATTPVASVAGPTTVAVTTPNGTSGPLAYTYVGPSITAVVPDQGPTVGGQSVTITGSGFAPGAAVTIGGAPALAVTVDPTGTSITATTPPGTAGPADVAVVQVGPDAVRVHGYTYIAPGAPTIESIDPNSGPTAGGQTVTIVGSGFNPGSTAVSFDGTPGTDVDVTSSTTLTVVTPAHVAGAVDVQVSNAFGDSGTRSYTYLALSPRSTSDPGGTSVEGLSDTAGGTGGSGSSLPFTGFDALAVVAFGTLLLSAGTWCAAVRRRGSIRMNAR